MSKSSGMFGCSRGFTMDAAVTGWVTLDVVLSSFHMKSSSSTPRKGSSVDIFNYCQLRRPAPLIPCTRKPFCER